MILASGARGREFDSRNTPCHLQAMYGYEIIDSEDTVKSGHSISLVESDELTLSSAPYFLFLAFIQIMMEDSVH
ncbi:hypothetical protein VNO80_15409 [Phaseolus coccineus]|uniref:Uncharacterized protein n=1 Tax=Phaseolus coccineus TaxID=3886 RepID=A0AAN9MPY3_PHACN